MPLPATTCHYLMDFLCIQERLPKMERDLEIKEMMKWEIIMKTGEKLLNKQPTDGGPDSSYISNSGKGKQKIKINPNALGSNVQDAENVQRQRKLKPIGFSTRKGCTGKLKIVPFYHPYGRDYPHAFTRLPPPAQDQPMDVEQPVTPDISQLLEQLSLNEVPNYFVLLLTTEYKQLPSGLKTEGNDNQDPMTNNACNGEASHQLSTHIHLRNACHDTIKDIHSGIYALETDSSLNCVREKLLEVDHYINGKRRTLGNQPLRQEATSRGKAKRLNRKSVPNEKKKEVPTKSTPSSDQQRLSQLVDDIWAQCTPTGKRLGKIGPYTIFDSSIKYLETALSDEVMDAVFHLIAEDQNLFHISSIIMTAIMTGEEHTNILQHVNIYQYEMLVGAVNEGGNHWTLIIIQPQTREIFYIDPLGETDISSQKMLQNWYGFLRRRQDAKIDSVPIGLWQLGKRRHSLQKDGISCGIYVLKFAAQFLDGNRLTVKVNNLKDHRKEIALALLSKLDTTNQDTEVPMKVDED